MSKTNKTGKTILIVEDSTTQALHLQALLEEAGLQVIWAPDGQAGVKMAHQALPDLVVLDVQLPDMNGFQVCQDLKSQNDTRHIPIIMFTRHDDPEAVVLGLQTGVVDYIPKDAFADAVLIETLRQMGLVN
ncbi:MAG: response regulator receiver protein [Chloroflexi bacterium]|nr:response regulator receiver protein [Chloroflexota bacterium]